MSENGNVALVKALYDDFMRGAYDALLERLDDNVV
jgi:ketosteroid isomerase-like protein